MIAAHDEAAGIGRCLDGLLAGTAPGELDVTVVANGCTDDTAAVAAARPGVRVIDLPRPGKAAALNAGDAVAVGFPRVYLDADIALPAGAVRQLCEALAAPGRPGPLAVVPRRRLDVRRRPLGVRAYYAVNARMPAYRGALFGRGVIALSAAGRARFAAFPDVLADDLFLDSLFTAAEKHEVAAVAATIATPRRTRDLVARLVRVRSANAALRSTGPAPVADPDGGPAAGPTTAAGSAGPTRAAGSVRPAARWSWLRDVVLPRPWLAPAAVGYVAITLLAAARARRSPATADRWGRDGSSREAAQA